MLVEAALPGAVRIAEGHLDAGIDGEGNVARQLLAWSQVIERTSSSGKAAIAFFMASLTFSA